MLEKEKLKITASVYDIYVIGEQIRCQMHAQHLIKDRRYHLRKYRQCFVSKDAVDWALKMCHAHSREEAVLAMQCLQHHGMIHHVVDEHTFKDQNLFFRFTRDDDTYLTNSDLVVFYRGLEVYNSLKDSDVRRDFYHRGHLYEGAFYGNDLVDYLCVHYDVAERQEIVSKCRELLEYDIIKHVTDDYHFSDDRLMYQFRVEYSKACILSDILHPTAVPQQLTNRTHDRQSPSLTDSTETDDLKNVVGVDGSSVDDWQASSSVENDTDDSSNNLDPRLRVNFSGNFQYLEAETRITMVKKIVKVEQDGVGYGFVLRGSSPCYVQTVDPLGPAAAAGIQVGQYVISVAGKDVTREDHRHVGRIVMTHTGILTLAVMTTQKRL